MSEKSWETRFLFISSLSDQTEVELSPANKNNTRHCVPCVVNELLFWKENLFFLYRPHRRRPPWRGASAWKPSRRVVESSLGKSREQTQTTTTTPPLSDGLKTDTSVCGSRRIYCTTRAGRSGEETAGAAAGWTYTRMVLAFADPDAGSTEPDSQKYHSRRDTVGSSGSALRGRCLSVGCGSPRGPLPASLPGPFPEGGGCSCKFPADTLFFSGVSNNQLWL